MSLFNKASRQIWAVVAAAVTFGVINGRCVGGLPTTHFELTQSFRQQNPSADRTGVNMKLFDPDA